MPFTLGTNPSALPFGAANDREKARYRRLHDGRVTSKEKFLSELVTVASAADVVEIGIGLPTRWRMA
jgi:hypothetical protein